MFSPTCEQHSEEISLKRILCSCVVSDVNVKTLFLLKNDPKNGVISAPHFERTTPIRCDLWGITFMDDVF